MKPPQTFALAFLILSCTRGTAGVTFVASHIRKHWKLFRSHFHDFCKGLVRASRLECCKRGQQFLSHREGLHAALSGKHFLDTLARRKNRNALLRIGEEWGASIEGAFSCGGRVKALEASQVFALGDCLTTLALAEHNQIKRCMGKYNKTHTLRTFMAVHEQILGAPAAAYTEELHHWFTRGLSKRSASGTFLARSAMARKDARSFQQSVRNLQTAVGPDFTVTWSTVFVLRCETRQVCQKYGIGGIQKMTQAVHRSSTLQALVEEQRQALLREETPGKCHTVQIFDAIAKQKGWSQQYLRRQPKSKSVASVCRTVGAGRLCPKVVLEGIPEWVCLKKELQRIGEALGIQTRLPRMSASVVKSRGVTKRQHGEVQDVFGEAGATLCDLARGKERKLNHTKVKEP